MVFEIVVISVLDFGGPICVTVIFFAKSVKLSLNQRFEYTRWLKKAAQVCHHIHATVQNKMKLVSPKRSYSFRE